MKITEHQKLKYVGKFEENISGDQGNMQWNFREQGNLTRVNLREHLNLFLGNKGKTPREHAPPLGDPHG